MAVPTYSEDLTDIDLGESTTGWSAYGGGGAGLGTGADFAIQGTLAVDKQITGNGTIKGMMHNDGGITLGASDHIWGWIFAATPGIIETLANGGKRMSIGTGTTARNDYYLEGSDTRPEGGNKCYCVRYSTATPSPGSKTGSPGATPTYFGGGLHMTDTAKAANLGCDAFRYGTGAYITAGEVANPATFSGFATQDELSANKWGILFRVSGTFQMQGRFVIGQNNAGTATAAHFNDSSGAVITFTDTPHSQTDFTQIIIDHASTVFVLEGATFIGLGTNNPGQLNFTDVTYTTDPELTGCVFKSIGTTDLQAEVAAVGCDWSACDLVTQNGAVITVCDFSSSANAVALLVDDINNVTDCNFVSDGTGHAIEYAPVGAGPFVVNWDGNTDSGFSATDGSTGNETILIHPGTNGADITINVVNGGGTPTIMEHADYTGTVTVQNAVTLTVTVFDDSTGLALESAHVWIGKDSDKSTIASGATNSSGVYTTAYSYVSDTDVVGWARQMDLSGTDYTPKDFSTTITTAGMSITVRLQPI